MHNERIARLARDAFLNEPLLEGFTAIRWNPSIKLRTILLSLFLMPFFGLSSLLSNDREARTEGYKGLFGCQRRMVCSDSTYARVLKRLKPQETRQYLLSFLDKFEHHDLLRICLSPEGPPRRLGILDGSYMGGHWLVSLCLPGLIAYPVMVRRCESQGQEQKVARQMMHASSRILGKLRPQLIEIRQNQGDLAFDELAATFLAAAEQLTGLVHRVEKQRIGEVQHGQVHRPVVARDPAAARPSRRAVRGRAGVKPAKSTRQIGSY